MRADYLKLRDRILEGCSDSRHHLHPAGRAFYVYPNVSLSGQAGPKHQNSPPACCMKPMWSWFPGEAFGTQEHIRLSYAVAHSDIEEGLVRMKKFLRQSFLGADEN